MTKVPSLNYPEVIRAFQRGGWNFVSQKGSHIKLERGSVTVIVPAHKPIKRSTLAAILKQSGTPLADFLDLLR